MLFSFIILLLLLNNLLMLASAGPRSLILLTGFQAFLLGILLFGMADPLLAIAVLAIKGALLPALLLRTWTRLKRLRLDVSQMNRGLAVALGLAALILSLWFESRLPLAPGLFPHLLLPTAIMTLFCGLLLVVGRRTALAQVVGYLVSENGIFLLGIPLMAAGAIWFELALLLDIFVAVFVMGIAISHIGETFDSMDTDSFRSLRD